MPVQRMKSDSSIDDAFYEESSTTSQDFETMSAFTGSAVLEEEEVERPDKPDVEEESVAKEEKEAVARVKAVVVTVLCVSVVGMVLAVFFYASRVEENKFEELFILESKRVFDAVESAVALKLFVMDAFLTNVASYAETANASWPFVTTPEFAARASHALIISDSSELSQYHVVRESQIPRWEEYSAANDAWVEESLDFQLGNAPWNLTTTSPVDLDTASSNSQSTYFFGLYGYMPLWQNFPVESGSKPYNSNGVLADSPLLQSLPYLVNGSITVTGLIEDEDGPASEIHMPILDGSGFSSENLSGVLSLRFLWTRLFQGAIPAGGGSIVVVVKDGCNETWTLEVEGERVDFLGFHDYHDDNYDHLEEQFNFTEFDTSLWPLRSSPGGGCQYSFSLYPTESKEKAYDTSNPFILSIAALIIFLFTAAHFTLYDYVVEFKNQEVMNSAAKSNAIIKSLFPSTVRDRIFEANPTASKHFVPPKARLGSFLRTGETSTRDDNEESGRPIADLFPETTVMFADIAGFTAWSSVREPTHVFTLLEAIYSAFDSIAKRRNVFKVETIGDAYVAVAGLPDPRADHAAVMVKFARECRAKCEEITRNLETTLGPGTGELRYRFGLHSGPVTAGVLRGEKSRFQLFGDTVNTAARMETTGFPNRIHVSEATAHQLMNAGKSHWVQAREDKVEAKGKGLMQTYWIEHKVPKESKGRRSVVSDFGQSSSSPASDAKIDRLITWNTDILKRMLRHIIASRGGGEASNEAAGDPVIFGEKNQTVLDEVQEIIELPDFDGKGPNKKQVDPDFIELDAQVCAEMREYVTAIAQSYRSNAFHSFDHASHVLMSVSKLLNRIVAPDMVFPETVTGVAMDESVRHLIHDHTFGITSDPLTQFACVFAALIHDCDHRGVPNTQLVREEIGLAEKYGDKATAEQNSVDIAWDLLMSENFKTLRKAICNSEGELHRFRQLVVNSVMATDIVHPDLKRLRNDRWDKAFSSDFQEPDRDRVNRKATIVIEHLIQASDVAHTMQHWHVYCKWNAKLFEEMHDAYRAGRSSKDPAEFWYEGEIGFFDHYIIPLAKKLSDCGVFGVSSDEYLTYAMKNREEWERRGESVVASLVEKVRQKEEDATTL